MHTPRWISFLALCVLFISPVMAWAADKVDATELKGPSPAPITRNTLKITLIPSREQAVAGSYFGITARVENVSDKAVYFTPRSFTMTAPPELDPEGPRAWPAFFADVQLSDIDRNKDAEAYWKRYDDTVMVLTPGSNVSAFWSGRFREKETSPIGQSFRNLSFVPGRYTLTVVASYWDTPDGPTNKAAQWHTQTVEMQEVVSAPQSVILFGAGLGGVFAFLLVWRFNESLYSGWGRGNIIGVLSAISLSIIVTILLARLSDSQFIIRVTVSDLWGAMAVGFIGAASGPAILQKFVAALRGPVTKEKESQPAEKQPTAKQLTEKPPVEEQIPSILGGKKDEARPAAIEERPDHRPDANKAA